MVDYFGQKKIREIASDVEVKHKTLDYAVIRRELKAALVYINKLKLHPSEVLSYFIDQLIANEIFS